MRQLMWFRTDLRVHDNVILHEAARRVEAGQLSEVCTRCHQGMHSCWFHELAAAGRGRGL